MFLKMIKQSTMQPIVLEDRAVICILLSFTAHFGFSIKWTRFTSTAHFFFASHRIGSDRYSSVTSFVRNQRKLKYIVMSRLILSILVVTMVTLYLCEGVEAQLDCGRNKHYDSCGTPCPLTCEHQQQRPCVKRCKIGCQCNEGLVLRNDGSCVHPASCRQHRS